jgi:hypothetical protein
MASDVDELIAAWLCGLLDGPSRLWVVAVEFKKKSGMRRYGPAVAGSGAPAFADHDVMRRVAQLRQDREVQSGWPCPYTSDSHASSRPGRDGGLCH